MYQGLEAANLRGEERRRHIETMVRSFRDLPELAPDWSVGNEELHRQLNAFEQAARRPVDAEVVLNGVRDDAPGASVEIDDGRRTADGSRGRVGRAVWVDLNGARWNKTYEGGLTNCSFLFCIPTATYQWRYTVRHNGFQVAQASLSIHSDSSDAFTILGGSTKLRDRKFSHQNFISWSTAPHFYTPNTGSYYSNHTGYRSLAKKFFDRRATFETDIIYHDLQFQVSSPNLNAYVRGRIADCHGTDSPPSVYEGCLFE